MGTPMAEITRLGCIYGLSAVFFPVFDKIVSARTEADLETQPETLHTQHHTHAYAQVSARTEADLETQPSRRRYKRSSEGGSWGADDLNACARLSPEIEI